MDAKPKISPNSTVVLDDDELQDLDSLTLTSVIRDASEVAETLDEKDDQPAIDDVDLGYLSPD
jgi:hypothetical protein